MPSLWYSIFFVGDKEFESITELLNDTLIVSYIEKHENINQKLAQGQSTHSQSNSWKRRRARYKRRGHVRRLDSTDSMSIESTDGLSPAPSLSSLTDIPSDEMTKNEAPVSDLDHINGGNRQQAWKKGSTKSVIEPVTGSSGISSCSFLPIPRCASSPSKGHKSSSSSSDLSNIQGMLATLVQTTVATEVSYI